MFKCWALLICLLAGSVDAHVLQQGKTYEYDYRMVVLSGIPELNEQYAAHGLKAKVHLHTVSDRQIYMEIKNVQVAKENKEFNDTSPEEIDLKLHSSNAYQNLTKPSIINYESDGTVRELQFQPSDPEWSRKVKIGLATMFQVKKLESVISSNSFNRGQQDEQVGTVVEHMEPSPSGICNSIYSYTINPREGQKEIIVDKIRDYHDCKEKPYFGASTHRRFKCNDCQADESHPFAKQDVCKYNISLSRDSEYVIQRAICDGIVKVSPIGQQADSLTVIHNRTLELQSVQSIRSKPEMSYEWETEKPYSNLTDKLENIRNPESLDDPIIYDELCGEDQGACKNQKEKVRQLLKSYADKARKINPSVDELKQMLDEITIIQRGLISLSYQQLEELAREAQRNNVSRQVFWEHAAIAATNPAIKLIMEATKKRQLQPNETASLLPTVAAHVLNPNTLLADKMLEFCMSPQTQQNENLTVACYLAVGTVIAKTAAKGDYPIPKTHRRIIQSERRQHYISALKRKLDSTDDELQQAALLMALGNTALEEAIPVIEEYIRASDDIPTVVQVKAIYALLQIARQFPEQVREPLNSVLFNEGENTEARIAAFNVLVVSRPSRHLYEKIAAMTQYGQDTTLNVYIYSSFKSLANATHACLADASGHAEHAVNLMDDEYDTSAWIAQTTVLEGNMEYLDADAYLRLSSVGDAGSMTPSMFYMQLRNLFGDYASNLFSLAFYGNNTSYLINNLIGAPAILQSRSVQESIQALNKPLKNMGLESLAEQIGFAARKQPKFSAMISTRFMDFQQQLVQVDKQTLLNLIRSAHSLGSKSGVELQIDTQKTMMPLDITMLVPIDSGYMYHVTAKVPIHMSLKGEIKITPKPSYESMNFELEARVRANVAARALIQGSVRIPDEQETSTLIAAGYETTEVAAPLISGKMVVQMEKQKLSVQIKPTQMSGSDREWEVAHYHTRPYTSIEPLNHLKRLEEVAKTIHSQPSKSRYASPKAQKELPLTQGQNLVLRASTESYWNDSASIYRYFQENDLLGIAVNGWAKQQWVPREYTLVLKNPKALPELSYKMEWEYKPAPGEPSKHISSSLYIFWRSLFGQSDVPMRCQQEDYESDKSSSSSSQSESQESRESYRDRYQYSNERQQSGSGSDQSGSSEEPSFGHFSHGTNKQGQWQGFRSNRYSQEDASGSASQEDRWGQQSRHPRWQGSASKSDESSSSEGRWMWKSDRQEGDLKIEQASLNEGVSVYIVRAEAKMRQLSQEKGLKIEVIVTKPQAAPNASVDILVKTIGQLEHKQVCLSANYSGEYPPCFMSERTPKLKYANITLNATLTWGSDCSRPEGFLDVAIKANKSREQLEMRKSERPYFYDQCKEDRENGRRYTPACLEKLKHQSRLNHINATIKYRNIPSKLMNFTEKLQDHLVYSLYPHLSHDSFARNRDKQIQFTANFHPTVPVVDLKVKRPHETLQFSKVFYGDYEPFVQPPSIAGGSYIKRAVKYYTDSDLTPTCYVTDEYVNNFNNNTYDYDHKDECEYLITGDCRPSNMFSVSLQKSRGARDSSKILKVQLLKNKILIDASQEEGKVEINGKQISMRNESIAFLKDEAYGPTLLGYIVKADQLFKVVMPFNRISVVFDGENVTVLTSNIWRNKLCGLCGEYNPQDEDDFTGPRQCRYSEPNDFAQSYRFQSGQCPRAQAEGEKLCASQEMKFRHEPSRASCMTEKPIMKRFGSKICGSQEAYKTCQSHCSPSNTEPQEVSFKCVSEDDSHATELLEEPQQWLEWAQARQEDFTHTVDVPTSCSQRY